MPTESHTQTKYKKGKIYDIDLDQLVRDIDQPRKHFDEAELESLKLSIKDKGLLYPIIFRVDDTGSNVIVSGERRFKAFKALGKACIPAMLVNDDTKWDEIAVIDNIQRSSLNVVEESEALNHLVEKYGHTQELIGNLIGKAQNTVSDILALKGLSEDVRILARERKDLSRAALLKIAKIKRPTSQRKAYDALVASISAPKKEIKRPRLTITKRAITTTDNSLRCLKEIDLDTLGDDRDIVVSKLQDLLLEIQNKLAGIGG